MSRPLAALAALAALCLIPPLTADEPDKDAPPKGFTRLFNGKDTTGWKAHDGKTEAWKVEKGVLYVKGGGGWLMTEKEYGDFELRLEYKLPKGGNSGVALRAPRKGNPAFAGMEIQILDDLDPQYKKIKPYQRTGSIYSVVPSSKQPSKPIGEWNSYRIVCKGRQVTVELNGEKIVDANLDDYKEKHAKDNPGILREKGCIGLQDHGGGRLEFRNIFIKELK
jgi:hypothetical protein